MNNADTPIIVQAHEGRRVNLAGVEMQYKIHANQTDSAVAVGEWTVPPGVLGAPPHKHDAEDEFFYVLEGELSVMQDDQVMIARQGETVILPRGRFHTFWNAGTAPVRALVVLAPGQLEAYFYSVSSFVRPDAPPDLAQVAEIAKQYGLTFDFERMPHIIQTYGLQNSVAPPAK